MALAVNRTGVILKKCDMSNHRPETVRLCAPVKGPKEPVTDTVADTVPGGQAQEG